MKSIILITIFFTVFSAHAAPKEWVSVEVKVKSHHGNDETMNHRILKDRKGIKLIVDDFVLPETRILTNKRDLDDIVNFSVSANDLPCSGERYYYIKKSEGKRVHFSGCPLSKNFQVLRHSFQNITAIR